MTTIVTKKTMKSPLSSFISFVILRVAVLSSLSILMASTSLSSGSFLAVSAFSVSPPMIDKNRHHLHSSSWSKSSSSPHSNSNLIMLKAGLFGEQGSAYNNDINNNYNNQIRNVTTYISSTSVRFLCSFAFFSECKIRRTNNTHIFFFFSFFFTQNNHLKKGLANIRRSIES
jgi:hypothetical protein